MPSTALAIRPTQTIQSQKTQTIQTTRRTQKTKELPTINMTPIDASSAIRASYLRFSRWTQHLWTWITGRALPGQDSLVRLNPYTYLTRSLIALVAGIASAWWIVASGPAWAWVLLPLCWLLTTSASRVCVTVVAHHCLHSRVTRKIPTDPR